MSNPRKERKPKIVGWGNGPHIYATDAVSMMFDGSAVTLTLGNAEIRIPEIDAQPTEPPVIAVSGKITLTPAVTAKIVHMLTNLLNTLEGKHPNAAGSKGVN